MRTVKRFRVAMHGFDTVDKVALEEALHNSFPTHEFAVVEVDEF